MFNYSCILNNQIKRMRHFQYNIEKFDSKVSMNYYHKYLDRKIYKNKKIQIYNIKIDI